MPKKPRSKANGEGTIYKYEKNGKTYYRGMIATGYDEEGKLIRKSFNSAKKSEVINKMAEYKNKQNTGLLSNDDKITLQQWFYTWLFDFRVNDLKPSSLERYEGIYRNYIKDSSLGKKKLADIRTIDIQKYYSYLMEKSKKSPNSIKTLNKYLGACFSEALKQNYIVKNYCQLVTLPKIEKSEDITVFTIEEQKTLINSLEGHKLRMLILMALSTGLRQGELLGLKWNDLDLDNDNTVSVNKSIKLVYLVAKEGTRESKILEQTPKTKSSIRVVPIPSKIVIELKNYKIEQNNLKSKIKDLYVDNDIVFADDLGMYLDSRYLSKRYTKILKDAKIPYKKFHSLRHTYCTRLFEVGIPIKTVQVLMGHSDIKTTMNIYTHVMPEEKMKAVDKLNELF